MTNGYVEALCKHVIMSRMLLHAIYIPELAYRSFPIWIEVMSAAFDCCIIPVKLCLQVEECF